MPFCPECGTHIHIDNIEYGFDYKTCEYTCPNCEFPTTLRMGDGYTFKS